MSDSKIMKGAEPFFFKGNDTGVLVSHGFTGTPQSMRYYGEALHSLWLENSYHVATIDNDKDLICERACAFIRSVVDKDTF